MVILLGKLISYKEYFDTNHKGIFEGDEVVLIAYSHSTWSKKQ